MTPLDPQLLDSAKTSRERLIDAQHTADEARADYQHAIRKLHAGGGSMREIADALDLSHQRVHQIVDDEASEATRALTINLPWSRGRERKGSARFARFRPPARAAIVHAQDEARALEHGHIGTEHILLGVLRAEDGLAVPALRSLGVTLDATRAAVVDSVGRGPGDAGGGKKHRLGIPFAADAKKSLELSLRESMRLGDDHIGTEHLLLGLVRDADSTAAKILAAQGADADAVRAAVERH